MKFQPRHRVWVQLVHFTAGRSVWRAGCTCHWRHPLKRDDVDQAVDDARDHTRHVIGLLRDRDTLLEA